LPTPSTATELARIRALVEPPSCTERVLTALHECGWLGQAAIAAETGLGHHAVAYFVRRLLAEGRIVRAGSGSGTCYGLAGTVPPEVRVTAHTAQARLRRARRREPG
jgi:hypothetical protein